MVVATLSGRPAGPVDRSFRAPAAPRLARSLISQGGAFRIEKADNDDEIPKAYDHRNPQPA
jgi:hypothetical protein